jgi:molybdenum cofactor cytidylyltransferase
MGLPKQLLPFGSSTLIETVIDNAIAARLDDCIAVVNPAIAQAIKNGPSSRCTLIVNNDPNSAMLASVKLGIEAIAAKHSPSQGDGVLALLGDQPQLTTDTILKCASAYRHSSDTAIVIATYAGRRGHPAIFSWEVIQPVLNWPADRKLSELATLHSSRVREIVIGASAPIDVNTPEDYNGLSA